MDDTIDKAAEMLPAWFIPRMMRDEWYFGLALTDGSMLGISNIQAVYRDAAGKLWLDVRMLGSDQVLHSAPWNLRFAPTSRVEASVSVDHVMYAIELADT